MIKERRTRLGLRSELNRTRPQIPRPLTKRKLLEKKKEEKRKNKHVLNLSQPGDCLPKPVAGRALPRSSPMKIYLYSPQKQLIPNFISFPVRPFVPFSDSLELLP